MLRDYRKSNSLLDKAYWGRNNLTLKGNTMFNQDFTMEEFHRIMLDADTLLDSNDTDYLEAVAEAGDYLDRHFIDFISTPLTF